MLQSARKLLLGDLFFLIKQATQNIKLKLERKDFNGQVRESI